MIEFYGLLGEQEQKKRPSEFLLKVSEGWRLPTLPLGIAVPSALTGLTSLFGMGRGGSPSLLPPFLSLAYALCRSYRPSRWPYVYGVRERKYISLFCFVLNQLSLVYHAPQLKCRAISTARL